LLPIDSGDAVGVLCASLWMLQLVIRRKEPGVLSQGANIFGRDTGPLIVNRNFDWLISYAHSPRTMTIPSPAIYIYMYSFNTVRIASYLQHILTRSKQLLLVIVTEHKFLLRRATILNITGVNILFFTL
jgi:hypothetical protein